MEERVKENGMDELLWLEESDVGEHSEEKDLGGHSADPLDAVTDTGDGSHDSSRGELKGRRR